MAGHAGLRGWNARKRRLFNRCMAIAAIDSEFPCMVAVAERHGLLARNILVGVPRRHRNGIKRESERANDHDRAKNREPRDHVRAAMEYLWHRFFLPLFLLSAWLNV